MKGDGPGGEEDLPEPRVKRDLESEGYETRYSPVVGVPGILYPVVGVPTNNPAFVAGE